MRIDDMKTGTKIGILLTILLMIKLVLPSATPAIHHSNSGSVVELSKVPAIDSDTNVQIVGVNKVKRESTDPVLTCDPCTSDLVTAFIKPGQDVSTYADLAPGFAIIPNTLVMSDNAIEKFKVRSVNQTGKRLTVVVTNVSDETVRFSAVFRYSLQ
jgi:hypothetical protein